jgi:hypothetical protein
MAGRLAVYDLCPGSRCRRRGVMSLPTGLKAAVAALAGAMAPSALAGCSVDIGPLQHRTESYSVYGPLRTLVVNAHVGHVQITGGNSGQVRRYLLDAQLELGVILARSLRNTLRR